MKKMYLLCAACAVLALACGGIAPLTPTIGVEDIVVQTMAAYTVEAALTRAAVQSQTSLPLAIDTTVPTPEETAPATDTSVPAPEETAPDPLPASHTGVILDNGQCFNFDNGQVTGPDGQCDVWLSQPALFQQMNGARISGYVTLSPPSRSSCVPGRYEPGDLAVQTDMFMCFITNEAQVGFIVVRQYRGGIPSTGIVFDYWVFR